MGRPLRKPKEPTPEPAPPNPNDSLEIKVVSNDGSEMFFKIKRSTEIYKIKKAYCDRLRENPNHVDFFYDGSKLRDNDTAITIDMEPGDALEALPNQYRPRTRPPFSLRDTMEEMGSG